MQRLTEFCQKVGVTPEELAEMKETEVKGLLLEFLQDLEGKSYSYKSGFVCAVKSWLSFNDKDLKLKLKTDRTTKVSTEEKVPTREELGRILTVASLKAKVAISLMAFAGVRIEVIGNYKGLDGLRLKDVEGLEVDGDDASLNVIPPRITVRPSLSKAGHQYFTFLSEEGCEYLLAYLRLRLQKGEKLSEDSPLVPSQKTRSFLTSYSASELMRKAIRTAGFSWRPYVLRHYFDTQMLLAEAQGILPRDYRVFWMGHKGDIEHQYTTNKHRSPEDLIEDMREKYRLASKFLETRMVTTVEPRQKVVSLEELDYYLEKGWEFVTVLPDNRVIVKKR
jgi:integrase